MKKKQDTRTAFKMGFEGNDKLVKIDDETLARLQDILMDYKNDPRTKEYPDNDGKNLYKVLISNLSKSGVDEERFVMYLCEDIFEYEDLTKFAKTLSDLLN